MFESMVAVGAPGWFIVPPCVRSVPHVRLPVGARSFPMPLDSLLNRAEGTALRKGPPRGNAPRSEATEGRSRVRLDGCGSVGKPCPASEQLLRGSRGSPPYLVGVDGDDATSLADPATIDPDLRDIVMSASPRVLAHSSAAIASTSHGSPADGSCVDTFCRSKANFISSNRSRLLFSFSPSEPIPTETPWRRMSPTRADPEESFMFEHGQWATPVPVWARSSISRSSNQTQ